MSRFKISKKTIIFILVGILFLVGFGFLAKADFSTRPEIISASVEPEKVVPGDTMTITVEITDNFGIKSVTADMGGIETIELEKTKRSVYQETWEGKWKVHNTEPKKYITKITTTNILGNSSSREVEWSDPYVLQACPPASYTCGNAWDYSMGYKFTPTQNGQITKLCGYFSGTKTVTLYNSAYTVLASASVTSSNNWACTSITPVSVTASSVYYVEAGIANSGGCYCTFTTPVTCSTVTMNVSAYQSPSGTFNASHTEVATNMYGMADIEITYNQAPTITSVSESTDPIVELTTQTITPSGVADAENGNLRIYCCQDTTNICTPTTANICNNDQAWASPYTGMTCTLTAPDVSSTTVYYARCRLYDGTNYTSTTPSTSYSVAPPPATFTVKKENNCSCTCANGACAQCYGGYCCSSLCKSSSCNSAPTISSVSDSPDPQVSGSTISFTSVASDPDSGDTIKLYVCKAADCANCSPTVTSNCWIFSTSGSTTNPSASYTVPSCSVATQNYYANVCDTSNACSSITTVKTFSYQKENGCSCTVGSDCYGGYCCNNVCQSNSCNPPQINSVSSSQDSIGVNMNLEFLASWTDEGDSVKIHVCKTNSLETGSCIDGSWCDSETLTDTSPATCNFTTSLDDVGIHDYYAFICDSSNQCSSGLHKTFEVTLTFVNPENNIQLATTTKSGLLISSAFDTGINGGASFTRLMWKGDSAGGTVKFQIAFSNCSNGASNYPTCNSGDWTYYGCTYPDSTSCINPNNWTTATTSLASLDPNISLPFPYYGTPSIPSPQNNRYIRYKVYLEPFNSESPRIDDIIIYWSP